MQLKIQRNQKQPPSPQPENGLFYVQIMKFKNLEEQLLKPQPRKFRTLKDILCALLNDELDDNGEASCANSASNQIRKNLNSFSQSPHQIPINRNLYKIVNDVINIRVQSNLSAVFDIKIVVGQLQCQYHQLQVQKADQVQEKILILIIEDVTDTINLLSL